MVLRVGSKKRIRAGQPANAFLWLFLHGKTGLHLETIGSGAKKLDKMGVGRHNRTNLPPKPPRQTQFVNFTSSPNNFLEGLNGRFVIWMIGDFRNIFSVNNLSIGANHKHRPGEQRERQSLDQNAISLAK